mgnify:FL=1
MQPLIEGVVTTCDCHDAAHIMEFRFYPDDRNPEFFIQAQLNPQLGLWGRLWHAGRFILGKRSRFGHGHWDGGGLSPGSAKAVKRLIEKFLANVEQVGGGEVDP